MRCAVSTDCTLRTPDGRVIFGRLSRLDDEQLDVSLSGARLRSGEEVEFRLSLSTWIGDCLGRAWVQQARDPDASGDQRIRLLVREMSDGHRRNLEEWVDSVSRGGRARDPLSGGSTVSSLDRRALRSAEPPSAEQPPSGRRDLRRAMRASLPGAEGRRVELDGETLTVTWTDVARCQVDLQREVLRGVFRPRVGVADVSLFRMELPDGQVLAVPARGHSPSELSFRLGFPLKRKLRAFLGR